MTDLDKAETTLLDGRFQLEASLGRGGMAEVFRATDLRHARPVAVKILRSDVIDSVGVERFRREISVTANFTHPHILGLNESGQTVGPDGRTLLYYVMPLIEGDTLRNRLAREGHLSLRDAVRITREVLEALRYAHEHGVIHRDIKPANILLSDGHAVVADFGIAKPVARAVAGDDTSTGLTVSGVSVGTAAYMSPEQAFASGAVDLRSDLYATGCVLYEMLTGRVPFDGTTGQAVIARKMTGAFVPPTTLRPALPPRIDEIVARALPADPADRFASAAEFLAALDTVGDTTASSTLSRDFGESVARSRRRRRVALLALLALGLVAVGFGAWAVGRLRTGTQNKPGPSADPARVVVLPFENLSADTSLSYVANGITTDLIDALAQVHALTVVGKTRTLAFAGKAVGVDSVARALHVGSVITGDVRRVANSVSVSVRLLDGQTGQQLASHDTSGTMEEVLQVRSSIVDDVARFLRRRLGEQVRIVSARRRASSAEAWELVERVRSLLSGELDQAWRLSPADRLRRFRHADSLAAVAARLDKNWPEPLVARALVSARQALTEETAGLTGGGADQTRDAARVFYGDAVRLSTEALARDADDASALRVRGAARMALWRTSRDAASDSLRVRAEADLRLAVDHRPDLSEAWNDLSSLLTLAGDFAEAQQAAAEALRVDEYLSKAAEVITRLQFTALGAEQTDNAARWCAEGRRRFPGDQRFFACELTTLGWSANRPADVGRAWQILDSAEKRYSADVLRSGWAQRRMFVAAVAARAGLRDSAAAIIATTRAGLPGNATNTSADYGEAHVRALLGQNDEAIKLLERYLGSFPIQRRQVARMPWFRSLRADPRFIAMTGSQ
jgi:serine/threonine protein kinase/tetratricopeptide (TPR) repeat protein